METIENREDIRKLVHAFYSKIRENELLGPIFDAHISESQWPDHLSKLTDFWETNLLGNPVFRGSPVSKHINVDRASNHTIDQVHFGVWLQLWLETIDEYVEGENALKAKMLARKMASGQFWAIWKSRPENQAKQ